MRILTLFARHGAQDYPSALRDLDELFRRNLADADRKLLIIDNALNEDHAEVLDDRTTLIGSSNASWEFSAWDRGVAFTGAQIAGFDFVHLVSSAFLTLYTGYLDRIDARLLGLVQGRAAALGHIDYYNEPIELHGRLSQSWLRTSFVFMPPPELQLLGSLVSVRDGRAIFSDDPDSPFLPDAPLSKEYRANIVGWLTGSGTGQGVEWHSRFDLTDDTLPYFKAKALAIMNEHALSMRLRAQGCAMVDVTWLARQANHLAARGQVLGTIPSWRAQISTRNGTMPMDGAA
jgi:hypothetical protein